MEAVLGKESYQYLKFSLSPKRVWPRVCHEVAVKPSARLSHLKAWLRLEKLLPSSVPGLWREMPRPQILPVPDGVGGLHSTTCSPFHEWGVHESKAGPMTLIPWTPGDSPSLLHFWLHRPTLKSEGRSTQRRECQEAASWRVAPEPDCHHPALRGWFRLAFSCPVCGTGLSR